MSPLKRQIRLVFKITTGARAPRNSVLHRILVNSLCVILLCSTTPQLFAQRRIAGRVPAGEARPAPTTSARKSVGAKEKQRAADARTKARRQDGVITGVPGSSQEMVGVPTAGEIGVQKSTDEIMDEQASAPVIARRPLLVDEQHIPNRKTRPQDPNAKSLASTPSSLSMSSAGGDLGVSSAPEDASSPLAPQTLSTTFNGVTGPTETGAFPPDTMGAVGPTQFVLFVNGRLRTFNKTTGAADGVINVKSARNSFGQKLLLFGAFAPY